MKLKESSAQEFRFRTIVELRELGKTQASIAQIVGCSQVWVSKVLERYKTQGEKGIQVKGKAPGATPKLTEKQFSKLKPLLLQGALKHGFETDNWTRERIAKMILDKFSVSYHPAHISRLMRKLGFSLQKPKSKSYRKDEQEVEQWKNEKLPALKKSKK